VGCAEEVVEVALCRAVPVDVCPPTRYVTEADVVDAIVAPEIAFDAAIELKRPPMVAFVAVELDNPLLVES
jgi:hypothetical protein